MAPRFSAASLRPTPALAASTAVAAAVGATAVTLTAFAAPASAAAHSTSVWDRVASCESSNRWHIDTGNGYYGGLQFSSSTRAGFGGHRYAAQADGASRTEQIAIARRVLAVQGPHAWPVCSIRAGLTRANGGAGSVALPQVAGAVHGSAPAARASYRVRAGDTLSAIAARYHVAGGWQALWQHNRASLPNPDLLRVGQVVTLP
jgi:nucleoid-associated protein YgaU